MVKTKLTINPITGELDLITRVKYSQVEIDFGPDTVNEMEFTIVDPFINPNSIMEGHLAYAQGSGKDLDESVMDPMEFFFQPGDGQFTIYVVPLEGPVYGTFKLNYSAM